MEKLINPTSLLGHSSFQNPSSVDDYESGIEASVSSMASDEDEHNDQLISLPQALQDQQAHKKNSSMYCLKAYSSKLTSHPKRMNSSNSGTESNTTSTRATLKQNNGRRTLVKVAPSSSINKMSDLPTPSSGYDGDTEGPINEDV